MDSDLAEAIQAFKTIFQTRFLPADFRKGDPAKVDELNKRIGLTDRYVAFLKAADPVDVESVTPSERIRFLSSAELEDEQIGYGRGDGNTPRMDSWNDGWIVFAYSALLGDPYYLDTTSPDAEGDCAIMTRMNGTELKPLLCASSLACFLRIVAMAMEVADDFAASADHDEEHIFREALASKIRLIDPAALRDGHWT